MLENWCWEPAVLKRITSHYETQEKLSDELIDKLIKSRYVNIGLFSLRQLFFGTFDINVHTDTKGGAYLLSVLRGGEGRSLIVCVCV